MSRKSKKRNENNRKRRAAVHAKEETARHGFLPFWSHKKGSSRSRKHPENSDAVAGASIKPETKRKITAIFVFILFPALLNAACNIFYRLCNPYDGSIHFGGHLLSFILTVILNVLLLCIARKFAISCSILTGIYVVFCFGNQIKIVISGLNPLFFDDIRFITDKGTLGIILKHSDQLAIIKDYLPQALLFLALTALAIVLCCKFRCSFDCPKIRFPALALSLLLILSVYLPIPFLNRTVHDLFYDDTVEYDSVDYYNKQGVLGGLTGQYLGARLLVPTDYTTGKAEAMLDAVPTDVQTKEWGKPNIIVVFSESFFDLGRLEDVTFSSEITPNLSHLKKEGIFFNSLSSTFGGLSCNPEFSLLTSGNLSYYPLGFVPYPILYRKGDPICSDYPSAISVLKENGYRTQIVSAWEQNLCGCQVVYDHMGVDTFVYDYAPEIKGLYTSEKAIGDKIEETFNNKEKDVPLFYLTQTAQAHMPFYADKYDSYDFSIVKSPLDDYENGMLLSYAQGIYDADKLLGRCYDYIQTLEEPTVLVFFGDHLPILTHGSDNLYDKLSYFNTSDTLLNEARRYGTEGIILANFDVTDEIDYLGQDLILPYVFSKCDLILPGYYRGMIDSIPDLPCFNMFASYDAKGNLIPIENLTGNAKERYEFRRFLNCYAFYLDH